MEFLYGVIILAIIIGFVLFKTIRIVPQSEIWIVERLGKFKAEIRSGLHILLPFIDVVRYRFNSKDQLINIPVQEVITRDNAICKVSALIYVKVTDASKAAYGVDNYVRGVVGTAGPLLRNIIGEMDLNECLSSRELIKGKFKESLETQMGDWGVNIRSVEIQDILPSESMARAMEEQAAASRSRVAMETRAEGEKTAAIRKAEGVKQSQVLQAEARRDSAVLDAEALITSANATRDATQTIANGASHEGGLQALGYQLGNQYIESLTKLSASDNAKFVMLPADVAKSVAPFMMAGQSFGFSDTEAKK